MTALHKANSGGRSKSVKLGRGHLRAVAGEFSKSFPVSTDTGDIEIGFNFGLLADVDIKEGKLEYDAGWNPIKITAGDRLAVVMPLRV